MKVMGYVRVSNRRGRSGENFISPPRQRDEINAWAAREGAKVVEIVEDLDAKGWKERRELMRCVEAIERGSVDGMVVAKLDRFFRDQLGGHTTIRRIKDAQGFLAIPGDGIDTRNEAGKMMLGFLLTIAEGEIDRFRQIFADARKRAVARGIHPCPVPPIGYRRREDEAGHVLAPLEPHPIYAPPISELFERASRGESWAALARWLESRGVPTAYGNRTWTARAAKAVVRNRAYLGEARHGEFRNPDAHPALTDELSFRRAQRVGRTSVARSERGPALLAGLLRCAGCQYGMKSWIASGIRRYGCHLTYPAGRCPEPSSISVSSGVEEWVVERFMEHAGEIREAAELDRAELRELEREANRARAALEAFRDDPRIIEVLGRDGFVAGLRERQGAFERAGERLAEARAGLELAGALDPVELRESWPTLTVPERRRLLAAGIDCIFLRRGRTRHSPLEGFLYICWRGEAPADMPWRGRKVTTPPRPFRFPASALGEDRAELARH